MAQAAAANEDDPLSEARKEAQSVGCISHLKQLGLGARLWAADNGDVLPATFQSMSNELNTPKILVCPSDTGKVAATSWAALTPQNVSYEFLAPGISETNSPQIVIMRCPIHGHVGNLDGSATRQRGDGNGTLKLEQRGGYYFLTR